MFKGLSYLLISFLGCGIHEFIIDITLLGCFARATGLLLALEGVAFFICSELKETKRWRG